jgi:hypothetical protein
LGDAEIDSALSASYTLKISGPIDFNAP